MPSASPPDDDALASVLERIKTAAYGIDAVTEGTSYGTPALKVGQKLLARVKDADTVVLPCALEDKELLKEAAPDIYFETDHYIGWPMILVRISAMTDAELAHRLKLAAALQIKPKMARTAKS